jgi:hypothetical protein
MNGVDGDQLIVLRGRVELTPETAMGLLAEIADARSSPFAP